MFFAAFIFVMAAGMLCHAAFPAQVAAGAPLNEADAPEACGSFAYSHPCTRVSRQKAPINAYPRVYVGNRRHHDLGYIVYTLELSPLVDSGEDNYRSMTAK